MTTRCKFCIDFEINSSEEGYRVSRCALSTEERIRRMTLIWAGKMESNQEKVLVEQ